MIFTETHILSDKELKRLKDHQYSSSCCSLLDPLMQKYWNWFVTLVPLWIAPNLITMVGLMVNIVTTLVLVFHCPSATEMAPWWTTFSAALGLFIYQTLDAIDGKQARRTKTNSPLGELFDHGCDSLSTVFVSIASSCAVRLGTYPGWMLFQCLCASTLFYCAHWQTYVSGTLTFGTIDVTEGQIIVMAVMLLSSFESFFNLDIWSSSLYFFSLNQLSTVFGGICGLYAMFKSDGTIDKIFTGGAGKNGATVADMLGVKPIDVYITVAISVASLNFLKSIPACISPGQGKNGSTVAGTSVLSPASPLFLLVIPAWVIAYKSDQNIYHDHPILYVLLFGLIGAKITNRLVVAHMCKGEITHRDASMLAPLLLILNQYFNTVIPEIFLLYVSLVWVTLDLVWYCTKVCLEICDYLEVNLFTIPFNDPSSGSSSSHSSVGSPASNGSSASSGPVTRGRKKHSRN